MSSFAIRRAQVILRRRRQGRCWRCGSWVGHKSGCSSLDMDVWLEEVRPGRFQPRRHTMADRIREVTG